MRSLGHSGDIIHTRRAFSGSLVTSSFWFFSRDNLFCDKNGYRQQAFSICKEGSVDLLVHSFVFLTYSAVLHRAQHTVQCTPVYSSSQNTQHTVQCTPVYSSLHNPPYSVRLCTVLYTTHRTVYACVLDFSMYLIFPAKTTNSFYLFYNFRVKNNPDIPDESLFVYSSCYGVIMRYHGYTVVACDGKLTGSYTLSMHCD